MALREGSHLNSERLRPRGQRQRLPVNKRLAKRLLVCISRIRRTFGVSSRQEAVATHSWAMIDDDGLGLAHKQPPRPPNATWRPLREPFKRAYCYYNQFLSLSIKHRA